ncbi:hypothetical protein AMATHDRAFT_144503 [Amanita thiersii Skay4041]|uniref:FYVE-type domain-containing protein n=1 Tax=Amanita thiersii Skay4041 TaxID=703135 RepID=A0A2A9NSL3_9AGAR|nr:hypothetical protein AMATHDRAFT_144503 [Amanita thiersii Skay4041]
MDLTDDFIALRRVKHDGSGPGVTKRVERTKLERRLDKLISLHFPPSSSSDVTRRSNGDSRRLSAAISLEMLRNMSVSEAGSLWKGIVGEGTKDKTRDAEQRITPWQDDASATRCPLCDASFHPITNRKHHCRVCGKIICSLPPRRPQRPETCSLLFIVNTSSRAIEEVGEGVDYGVKRRRPSNIGDNPTGTTQNEDDDRFLKGVRICRQCRPVLLRKQYLQEMARIPPIVYLHEALVCLENEIEASLPQFHELLQTLSHNDKPTKEASAIRKRLLEAFAQYDALSKKIYQLPCPSGPKSSSYRVQAAILSRANFFLQKNMFPLKSLPTTQQIKVPLQEDSTSSAVAPTNEDAELAERLQPLLEQEALLESFVEEAKSRRKFEDVKTLKGNLDEIRAEIRKVADTAILEPPLYK